MLWDASFLTSGREVSSPDSWAKLMASRLCARRPWKRSKDSRGVYSVLGTIDGGWMDCVDDVVQVVNLTHDELFATRGA